MMVSVPCDGTKMKENLEIFRNTSGMEALMKNMQKWLPLTLAAVAVAVVLVVVLLESLYESEVQLNNEAAAQGVPGFLIERSGTSEFDLEFSTEKGDYVPGDFVIVQYQMQRPGYVYVWSVEPKEDGRQFVELIFPNSDNPVHYGQSGRFSFHAPFNEGVAYLQAVATTQPLSATDTWEDRASLKPEDAKQQVLDNIASRNLSDAAWSSSWTTYLVSSSNNLVFRDENSPPPASSAPASVVDALPRSETESGSLKVIVVEEGYCSADGDIPDGAKIYNAQVYVDSSTTEVNIADPSQTTAPAQPAFQFLNVETGNRRLMVSLPHRFLDATTPVNTIPASAQRANRIRIEPDQVIQACYEMEALPRGVAQFSASPAFPLTNQTVTFSAGNSLGASYTWDFGDGSDPMMGSAAEMGEVTHTYTMPDTYTATLTVDYARRTPGICPGNLRRLETQCVVAKVIEIAAPAVIDNDPQKIETPNPNQQADHTIPSDAVESLLMTEAGCFVKAEDAACGVQMFDALVDLAGALDEVSLSFDFRYKQFGFRQNELDKLSANSFMAVEIAFLDDQAKSVFPNTVVHCTLQTDENNTMDSCAKVIPIGDTVSGTVSVDLMGSAANLRAVNTMIALNMIQQLRVTATAHLNVRRNDIKDAPIEVEYSNLELRIDAGF